MTVRPQTDGTAAAPEAGQRGDRAPTSFDIAHIAGVSQPTVSRALSGSPMVSEATRLRIEAIARQLNYKVDKAASSLRKRRSDTLALLFFEDPTTDESLINPFFVAMLGSITRAAKRSGYDLLVSFQQLSDNWHTDYEDSHKADGIILLGYGDWELYRERIVQLAAQGTHFARWGSVDGADVPGSTIGSDNVAGGRMAAEHLIGLGRQRIAFLGHASSHYPEFEARHRGVDALPLETVGDEDVAHIGHGVSSWSLRSSTASSCAPAACCGRVPSMPMLAKTSQMSSTAPATIAMSATLPTKSPP